MRLRVERLLIALVLVAVPACVIVSTSSSGGPDPGCDAGRPAAGADAERAVLANVATQIALPLYRDFEASATRLDEATAAYEASLSDPDRDAARAAWDQAMGLWQAAEMLQLGPAGMRPQNGVPGVIGGLDLRDRIYVWPIVQCRIDQETVAATYDDPAAFAAAPATVRGLAVIEYLLFLDSLGNGCSAGAAINTDGTWAGLGATEIRRRRARYAHLAATLVRGAATELRAAWDPSGGDFAGTLSRAGEAGNPYRSAAEGLNALVGAMFYVDTDVKDMKLGAPAARTTACLVSSCPTLLESRWAGRAREGVLANLRAFERIFFGDAPAGTAPGLDDLLASIGAADVRDRVATALASAIAAVEALPPITPASLEANVAAVGAAYDAVKGLTDLLKSELLCVLGIDLPNRADGDND